MKGKIFRLLLSMDIIFLCLFLFSCASTTKHNLEGNDFYQNYLKLIKMQAAKDPLIGIWQGSQGGSDVILAVFQNDESGPEKLKAVILNGSEFQFGYSKGDPWFYVSSMAAPGTYAGRIVYKYLFWSRWYPTKITMNNYNFFTTYDDVPPYVKTIGGTTHSYMRKEPQTIGIDDISRFSGSGFLIRNTDLIITANHVVGNASKISVRFSDGSSYQGEVADRDAQNDLTVLKLRDFIPSTERGFELSPASAVVPGETVHAVGYPLGETLGKQPSIVSGEVSAIVGINNASGQFRTTIPINPGNSGGPILNDHGTVVGIAVATIRNVKIEGISFGIKIAASFTMLQKLSVNFAEERTSSMTADEIFRKSYRDVVYVKIQ